MVLFVAYLLWCWEEKARVTWKVVAEGEYDYSVFNHANYSSKSGVLVRKMRTLKIPMTRIYFTDGTTILITDYHPMLPSGTHIKILKNGLDQYKIEIVKTA